MAAMSASTDPNPYAPPKADPHGPSYRAHAPRPPPAALREAPDRLDEHLADQVNVDIDKEAAGPRLRVATIVFIALFAVTVLGALVGLSDTNGVLFILSCVFAGIFALFAI